MRVLDRKPQKIDRSRVFSSSLAPV